MPSLDLIGSLCSLLSTYYFIRINNKAWLIGLCATAINGFLYWKKGIYADMGLEVFYSLTMGYGWYQWQKKKNINALTPVQLNQLSSSQWLTLCAVLVIIFISIYTVLRLFTHSTIAFLDATTTTLSLVAQGLMCYKIIMTWVLWFITDTLYVVLYFDKNLPIHSGLMIIYTALAIIGYLRWAPRRLINS